MIKPTLVIGASPNPDRMSYLAIKLLRTHRHPVVAFGLKSGKVSDVEINTTEFPTTTEFNTVTLYVSPKNQNQLIDKVIALKPKRIIFNPGSENHEFEEKAKMAGIYTENSCTLVLLNTHQY